MVHGRPTPLVSGVILAAGGSSRLGRPKQLLPLAGEPLLRHTLRNALAAHLHEVVLVLGRAAEEIAGAVGDLGQRTVVNPGWAQGQSTSLRAGVGAVDPRSAAAVFLLGDQPQVGPLVIDALVGAFHASGAPVVQARYGASPGNPVLIGRDLFPELLAVTGDRGARDVVRAHGDRAVLVPIGGESPRDVDTEDDFRALLAAWGRCGIDTGTS